MEDLEKKLSGFKQHRLSRRADWKIRFRLHKIILKQKAMSFFDAFNFRGLSINNAVLVVLVVIFVISSTSLYAYGSEQVTPGKVLYPLKRTIETVKNELSPTGAAKADNYNGLSSRRLEEALILSNQGRTITDEGDDEKLHNDISASIDRAVDNYNRSVENTDKINNEEKQTETVDKLKVSGDDKIRVLEEIGKNINSENDHGLNIKINEAKEKIKERREYLNKNNEEKPGNGNGRNKFNKEKWSDERINPDTINEDIKVEDNTKLPDMEVIDSSAESQEKIDENKSNNDESNEDGRLDN